MVSYISSLWAPNLENDTEKQKEERQSIILRKSYLSAGSRRGDSEVREDGRRAGKEEGEKSRAIRIKHKSLILAQDERWRRA